MTNETKPANEPDEVYHAAGGSWSILHEVHNNTPCKPEWSDRDQKNYCHELSHLEPVALGTTMEKVRRHRN